MSRGMIGCLVCLFLAGCGARTGLFECDTVEGEPIPCENVCGSGVRYCFGGYFTDCDVPPTLLECVDVCGPGFARCEDGEVGDCDVPPVDLPCTNVCGEGLQHCEAGVLDGCEVPPTFVDCTNICGRGFAECVGGEVGICEVSPVFMPCSNVCGDGEQRCVDGELLECRVSAVERPCETRCGVGTEWCEDGAWGPCSADVALPPQLDVRVRDFRASHPDFEAYVGDDRGIVADFLGDDGKPVYAGRSTPTTTGRDSFDQWYRDVPGVNIGIDLPLELLPTDGGLFVFDDLAFFPIDGDGFGNEGNGHNFHFTLEATTEFVYSGGEIFRFRGDDDVFIFINGRLAIDLGGVHGREQATVDLDDIARSHGLVIGERYPLHLFFAERHTSESTFTVETTLAETYRCE